MTDVWYLFVFRCINHTYKRIRFVNHFTRLLLTRLNNAELRPFNFSPFLIYITVQNVMTVC